MTNKTVKKNSINYSFKLSTSYILHVKLFWLNCAEKFFLVFQYVK